MRRESPALQPAQLILGILRYEKIDSKKSVKVRRQLKLVPHQMKLVITAIVDITTHQAIVSHTSMAIRPRIRRIDLKVQGRIRPRQVYLWIRLRQEPRQAPCVGSLSLLHAHIATLDQDTGPQNRDQENFALASPHCCTASFMVAMA